MSKELTQAQKNMVAHMEATKALRMTMNTPHEFIYRGMEHFLLEHGVWYEVKPWQYPFRQGAPKNCFANAMLLGAEKGLRYVEGLAIADIQIELPIHHGWNIDEHGNVVDNTWMNTGRAYFGIEFSIGRADDAIWNGDSTVLDDYRRRHPLFREPWRGEDYSRVWEESEGLKLLRRMTKGESPKRLLNKVEQLRKEHAGK